MEDITTVSKIRELICHKIASLDDHCPLEDVSQALDQILDIFLELQEIRHDDSTLGDDVVTPLIVACDKAQEACIEWIVQKTKELPSLVNLLGSPWDHAGSGNTPLHYAASSGCVQAIPLLCENIDEKESVTTLLSQRNDNYDTCIMYAAIRGYVDFIRQVLRLFLENDKNTLSDATKLFELVNDDGETALNLACGHGHYEVMNLFLDEAHVTVTYDIVKETEERLDRLKAVIQSGALPENKTRIYNMQKCLVILKVALAKSSQASMEQLLAEEEEAQTGQKPSGGKAKKKKSRRKPKSNNHNNAPYHNSNNESETVENEPTIAGTSEAKGETETLSTNGSADVEQAPVVETRNQVVAPAVETLDTLSDPSSNTAQPTVQRRKEVATDLDVDAIIEALCLDTSMLLLNPQDMAVDLSPCQLDAVAAILRNQLQAVKEARTIQVRLRNQESQL